MLSWVIYDIGSTLFFVGVVGLFFPLWVTEEMGGDDATVGYTLAGAMAFNLVLAPVVGAFSDRLRRRLPILALGALGCAAATAFLATGNLTLSLVLFGLAMTAIYVADIIYNILLGDVSHEGNSGAIGGMGVAMGYLGAILAVVIGLTVVESRGYPFAFRAIGIVIVIVSIPLFLLLKERTRARSASSMAKKVRETWTQLKSSAVDLPSSPRLLRFLTARFWYSWSLYTASAFAVLYGTDSVGLSAREVQLVLMVGLLVAIPAGLSWGIMVDRLGPGRTLKAVLLIWICTLLLALAIPLLGLSSHLWWLVGVLSGIVIPGVWAADRPYLLQLAPPEYLGEAFGIRAMTGRLSAVIGPFVWGLVSATLGFGQSAALLTIVVCAAISYVLVAGVGGEQPTVPEE